MEAKGFPLPLPDDVAAQLKVYSVVRLLRFARVARISGPNRCSLWHCARSASGAVKPRGRRVGAGGSRVGSCAASRRDPLLYREGKQKRFSVWEDELSGVVCGSVGKPVSTRCFAFGFGFGTGLKRTLAFKIKIAMDV